MLTKEVHKQLVKFADQHQKADEYISGSYAWNGGSCAIGCAIHDCKRIGIMPSNVRNGDHKKLAEVTGIPEMILRLEDHIFEGLEQKERIKWPLIFWKAVQPGKDYSNSPARIMAKFSERLAKEAVQDDVKKVCKIIAKLWNRRADGDDPSEEEWDAARQQAYAARQQAYAARQQAYAAWQEYWRWCADVVIDELKRK